MTKTRSLTVAPAARGRSTPDAARRAAGSRPALRDAARHREADPGTARARRLEPPEQRRLGGFVDPVSVVGDRDAHAGRIALHVDPRARRTGLRGVEEEIPEDLDDQATVGSDGERTGNGDVELELRLVLQIADELAEIHVRRDAGRSAS
jgi:hypothetical protein